LEASAARKVAIEIESVSKTFYVNRNPVDVLEDVSLTVRSGEIAGVIGPSGAGKSTLIRCANLLERPTSGHVRVFDRDLTTLSGKQLQAARREIGMIFQSSSLLLTRTVSENIALPLEIAGVPRDQRAGRVDELIERVGLGNRADSYPAKLSGGQRQRVGIARALALAPSILLSDEATSGLDPDTTQSILALLRELRDDLDLTILLITHEMEVVRELCDHVTLLREGRVVESGAVAELAVEPNSTIGGALIKSRDSAAPESDQVVWSITYASTAADPGWLGKLQAALGHPVDLLGAAVEDIGGTTAGRVTVATSDRQADLHALLLPLGLHAKRTVEAAA
jgi:ABC-type methionine transport system ATPase subunit